MEPKKVNKKEILARMDSLSRDIGKELTVGQLKDMLKDFNRFLKASDKRNYELFLINIELYAADKENTLYPTERARAEYIGISAYIVGIAKQKGIKISFEKGFILIDGQKLEVDPLFSDGRPYINGKLVSSIDSIKKSELGSFVEDKERLPRIEEQYNF